MSRASRARQGAHRGGAGASAGLEEPLRSLRAGVGGGQSTALRVALRATSKARRGRRRGRVGGQRRGARRYEQDEPQRHIEGAPVGCGQCFGVQTSVRPLTRTNRERSCYAWRRGRARGGSRRRLAPRADGGARGQEPAAAERGRSGSPASLNGGGASTPLRLQEDASAESAYLPCARIGLRWIDGATSACFSLLWHTLWCA